MANEFDDLLNQAALDPTPPAQFDDLLASASGGSAAVGTAVPAADPTAELLDIASPRPAGYTASLFGRGVQRNFRQLQAVPNTLAGIAAEQSGDTEGMQRNMAAAAAIEAQAPQPEWSLQNIHGMQDFSYWVAERFGENLLTLGTSAVGGGAGMLLGHFGARALGYGALSRAALARAGTGGMYATVMPTETANTAQELYQVTEKQQQDALLRYASGENVTIPDLSTSPLTSTAAGSIKGLLEVWTPFSIARALTTPGLQLGKTFAGAVAKVSAKEAGTEFAQEGIDIALRMMHDPTYRFTGDGPFMMGEGAWRLAEATAAGGTIGAIVGAPATYMERRQERRAAETMPDESGLRPGERQNVPRDNFIAAVKLPDGRIFEGNTHGEAYNKAVVGLDQNEADDLADIATHGFLFNGKFLTNREAAVEFNRLHPELGPSESLGSEDLMNLGGPLPSPGEGESLVEPANVRVTPVPQIQITPEVMNMRVPRIPGVSDDSRLGQLRDRTVARYLERQYPVYNQVDPNNPYIIDANGLSTRRLTERSSVQTAEEIGGLDQQTARDIALRRPANDPGPITELRNMVLPASRVDQGLEEATIPQPENDILAVTPMIRASQLHVDTRDHFLDMVEANTPRYAVEVTPGKFHRSLVTDTDLEYAVATKDPQNLQRTVWQIDQTNIVPSMMMADPMDLPAVGSNRVWFLPSVTSQQRAQLLKKYSEIQALAEAMRPQALLNEVSTDSVQSQIRTALGPLVDAGLRVIPSRGASFDYFGPMTGTPLAKHPSTTGRSRLIFFLDVNGALISIDEAKGQASPTIPVSVDLNRFRPGEISALPQRFQDGTINSDIRRNDGKPSEPIEWQRLRTILDTLVPQNNQWTALELEKYRDFMRKEKVYIPVHRYSPGLVTLNAISSDKLTPGVDRDVFTRQGYFTTDLHVGRSTVFKESETHVRLGRDVDISQGSLPRRMANELKKMTKTVDNILKSIGIEKGLAIDVVAGDITNSATAYMDQSRIEFAVAGYEYHHSESLTGEALTRSLYSTLMHELGHFITYHYYQQLSTEVQQQLVYAHNKALLHNRVDSVGGHYRTASTVALNNPKVSHEYYYSFSEWLAEQFRRYATTDKEITSRLELEMQNIGNVMERYYKMVEKQSSKTAALNFSRPDFFFSGFMEYLRNYGSEKQRMLQRERQQAVYGISEDIYSSPVALQIMKQVEAALQSMAPMIPNKNFNAWFGSRLDPKTAPVESGAVARAIGYPENKVLMEIAVGSLQEASALTDTRVRIAHELIHAYRMLDIISREELNFLYTMAIRDGKALQSWDKAAIRKSVEKEVVNFRLEQMKNRQNLELSLADATELRYQEVLREETVAYYVGDYANSGVARGEAKSLLDRILQVIERIRNKLNGLGYQTRDDLLGVFFRGEMISRQQEQAENENRIIQRAMSLIDDSSLTTIVPDKMEEIQPGLWAAAEYSNLSSPKDSDTITYVFYKTQPGQQPTTGLERRIEDARISGEAVGFIITENSGTSKGHDINMIRSVLPPGVFGTSFMNTMLQHMQKDLNQSILPSAVFTNEGYVIARLNPQLRTLLKYYVHERKNEQWYSPNFVEKQVNRWTRIQQGIKAGTVKVASKQLVNASEQLRYWRELYKKVPKDIWTTNKQLLNQMFMLERNWNRDGVQGSITRSSAQTEDAQLQNALGQSTDPSQLMDNFSRATNASVKDSQSEMARRLGISFDLAAPAQPEVRNMRKLLERVEGLAVSEKNTAYLKRVSPAILASQEADRIGYFTRTYWGLRQLLWRNEHITGLVNYAQAVENHQAVITAWHREADDIARNWEKVLPNGSRRAELSEFMFWLSEQKYRSQHEIDGDIQRHPTQQEFRREITKRKFTAQEQALISELYQHPFQTQQGQKKDIFARFLDAIEQVSVENILRTVSGAQQQAQAITAMRAEMNEFRQKPYFPITRFGKHTISVRDAVNNKKVLWFAAYETALQRDNALAEVRARFKHDDIQIGRVPEEMFEFMGLPAPLIKAVRDQMPHITPEQQAWLEDFERIHMPDRTFRKRWLPKIGTPGHSMDAFRTFAHYFMHGSRYLARLQHGHAMSSGIQEVRNSIDVLPNGSKRRMIVDYMTKHYNYLMEHGKDFAKFKAFVSLWQLGFSPAAAFMNLTQTPMVSLPWLGGRFGIGAGTSQLLSSIKAVKNLRNNFVTSGFGNYRAAREEMLRQQRIDIGQAAELGAFAEGPNLMGLLAGTKKQKLYRNWSYYGMWMFQKGEQANREILMHAVWELSQKDYKAGKFQNKRLQEIENNYQSEIKDLQDRLKFSHQDAVSFLLAKEAIDQTQGLYAPYARPAFMRTPLAGTLLIFYQFTQMMTYAFRFNPGMTQMWLMMAAAYGLSGTPGAEDLNEILKLLGRKVFGQDWDVLIHARRFARDMTRGTVMDEVGPDLLLHGVSRYGFGLAMGAEMYGLGMFDASANGSMGKLIPGLYEGLHGINSRQKPEQFISDVTSRLAGAGFGMFFNLAQFGLESEGSIDSHKWETMMPRTLRAVAKAYRYTPAEVGLPTLGPLQSVGAATNRAGARLVNFSITDPEDLMAIVTQAMGFSPTRVNAKFEMDREFRETVQVYQARKIALYAQFDRAIRSGEPSAVNDVQQAIQLFNEQARSDGNPSMQIQANQLRQALQQRARSRIMQEQGLPAQTSQIPVSRQIQDLFPNVRPQNVR